MVPFAFLKSTVQVRPAADEALHVKSSREEEQQATRLSSWDKLETWQKFNKTQVSTNLLTTHAVRLETRAFDLDIFTPCFYISLLF